MPDSALPPLPILVPRAPVEHQHAPVQRPGVDAHVHRSVIGGPSTSMDIRFVASASVLAALLGVAESSTTGRVVIMDVGFLVTSFADAGHVFQVLTIHGNMPLPESPAIVLPQQEQPDGTFAEPDVIPPEISHWQKLSHRAIGGPGSGLRLYLSTELLRAMLDRASASTTRRAVMHRAGLVLDTYRPEVGVPYQVATVLGMSPVPENPAIVGAR